MTSKILVKLPTVPFSQGKKPHTELVAVSRNEPAIHHKQINGSGDRAAQLEQNMKFLQEQHQAILVALQKEVETLRQRNRDLQFQLVFSNGATNAPSSPSTPEDNGNGFSKSKGSPVSVNVASLQVELLERDLQDLKVSLHEAKSQNHYLIGIIDQQKKKLDALEHCAEKSPNSEVGVQVGSDIQAVQADLATRLEDAEAMVLCLRRENEDQRRELSAIKATANKGNGNGNSSGRNHGSNGHRSRGQGGGNGGQEQNSHRFPPLHNQSYWHHGSRGNNSFEHNSEYRGRGRQDKQGQDSANGGGTVLPQLRSGTNKAESFSYPSFHHRPRGYHNGSSYYSEGYRKYRGQRSQRDCKDRESREPRESRESREPREFREQNRDPKDQHKEYKDSSRGAKTSKEP